MQRTQRGEAAIKEGLNREIRQRRENAEIRAAVFRIFGVFRGSVLRVQKKKKLRLKEALDRFQRPTVLITPVLQTVIEFGPRFCYNPRNDERKESWASSVVREDSLFFPD